jgi:hypothetical protein
MFGAFCLAATLLEAHEEDKELLERVKSTHHPCIEVYQEIFVARLSSQASGQISFYSPIADFTDQQQEFVRRWARREINFVEFVGK